MLQGTVDQTLPVGNEGAGRAVAAGANAKHLEGKMVSLVSANAISNSSKRLLSCACHIMMMTTAEEAAFLTSIH